MTRGKKARALRVDRSAEKEARRRKERQQSVFTVIVIAIVLSIGGVLIYLSAREPAPDVAATPTEEATDGATEGATEAAELPVACGGAVPDAATAEKPTFSEPEQVLEEGVDYRARIKTSCGTIAVDLYEDRAPQTVNNFVFLSQQGFFDGLEIFRNARSIGALQTGAGTNEASFDIGYTIPDELQVAKQDGYPPGTLAMANAGPGTGGSQFFFVYNNKFQLPPDYAAFGKANPQGVKVLQRIGGVPTQQPDDPANEDPSKLVYIESVEILPAKK